MTSDITFLFWNLGGRPLGSRVTSIARHRKVDVLMLAECASAEEVLERLNDKTESEFVRPFSKFGRVVVFTRFPAQFLTASFEDDRISIRRLRLPDRPEILVVIVHLRSRLHRPNDASVTLGAVEHSQLIEEAEQKWKHRRTVAVGDFNMNPFDPGMTGARGFHAVSSRQIAAQGSRVVQGHSHAFFYNPMWSFLGDGRGGTPGTYYRRGSDFVEYFWHTVDQVLVRPELLDHFDAASVQILPDDGADTLLTRRGIPDRSAGSDHLPLLFRLAV